MQWGKANDVFVIVKTSDFLEGSRGVPESIQTLQCTVVVSVNYGREGTDYRGGGIA